MLDFERSDRHCRLGAPSSPRSFLTRSLLLGRRNFAASALSDHERGLLLGLFDPLVLRASLTWNPDVARQQEVAYTLLGCDRASEAQLEAAAASLLFQNVGPVPCGRRSGDRVFGWVASLAPWTPALRARFGADGLIDV